MTTETSGSNNNNGTDHYSNNIDSQNTDKKSLSTIQSYPDHQGQSQQRQQNNPPQHPTPSHHHLYHPHHNANNRFSINSIRLMCDAAEIGRVTDEAALAISNQVTQKLRQLISIADKFCFHSKRRRLHTIDIDHALKTLNMQPILGFHCNEIIPFRFATGGGHKIFYYDNKEVELADVIARVNIPKFPQDVAIELHWLAIDGIQPAIPENPPPLTRDEQRLECVDPLEALNSKNPYSRYDPHNYRGRHPQHHQDSYNSYQRNNRHLYPPSNVLNMEFGPDGRRTMIDSYDSTSSNRMLTSSNIFSPTIMNTFGQGSSSGGGTNNSSGKKINLTGSANTNVLKKHIETVQVKQLATHELSVEQQLYYKEITEACVGPLEQKRTHALNSLAHDPGLHQMLPRLCLFISEGVKINVVHNNLALIIYLMRMVKSLLDNPTLYLEKYLHELCPTVITCIVSKQICNRPEQENHYAIRDFASRSLANICKNYNTSTNCLQTRITRLLCKALDDPKLPLSSLYGCLTALCELGPEVRQTLVARRLAAVQERLSASSSMGIAEISRTSPEGRILCLLAKFDLHLPASLPPPPRPQQQQLSVQPPDQHFQHNNQHQQQQHQQQQHHQSDHHQSQHYQQHHPQQEHRMDARPD